MREVGASEVEIWIGEPSLADPVCLSRYVAMVASGGQVLTSGLAQRIGSARFIALARKAEMLVGGCALKRPTAAYVERVFKKSGLPVPDGDPIELGYLYVDEKGRGGGVAGRLLSALVARLDTREAFATTREDNLGARCGLERCGFSRRGAPYASADGVGAIVLYVRAP